MFYIYIWIYLFSYPFNCIYSYSSYHLMNLVVIIHLNFFAMIYLKLFIPQIAVWFNLKISFVNGISLTGGRFEDWYKLGVLLWALINYIRFLDYIFSILYIELEENHDCTVWRSWFIIKRVASYHFWNWLLKWWNKRNPDHSKPPDKEA